MCFFPSDILLSIAAFLTFQNVFVENFMVYFRFPQKVLLITTTGLAIVAAKGIVHPAFSRQHPRKFWSFAVLSPNSLPVSQFPASFTSEWRIQMGLLGLFAILLFTWSICSIFFSSSVQCKYDTKKSMLVPFHEALVISYISQDCKS